MNLLRRALMRHAAAVASLAALPALAQTASTYPNRPIKIIVPFTAGSGSDNASRVYGELMGRLLGQSFVVENKPGANGVIALQQVKQAPADGYTIVLASNSPMAVNPLVIKDLPYDPSKDFKPIGGLTRGMNVLVVSNDSKFKTLGDLVAASKALPKGITIATYSAGYHLAAEWLASMTGMKFTNVPYKGQAPVMTDLIGNQLDAALVDMSGSIPLLKSGKLRAIAASGETRNSEMPDVPTVKESGYPDYVQYSWTSFYVRTETPADIVNKLADALQKAHTMPEAKDYAKKTGGELMGLNATQMTQFHQSEIERFRRIAIAAGIKPE